MVHDEETHEENAVEAKGIGGRRTRRGSKGAQVQSVSRAEKTASRQGHGEAGNGKCVGLHCRKEVPNQGFPEARDFGKQEKDLAVI